jgi:hypothetical protein
MTNRELIRRKFVFNQPNKKDLLNQIDEDDDDIIQGSTVFDMNE